MSSEFGKGLGEGFFATSRPSGYHADQCRDGEAPIDDLRMPEWFRQRAPPAFMNERHELQQSIRPLRQQRMDGNAKMVEDWQESEEGFSQGPEEANTYDQKQMTTGLV
mmetsp:Transcript_18990/g.38571  ORF Transcript_18990/g.38571 Transcript_18990/m.38571 type:complete len:108 (-) Transcript_18990:8-331(-)